MPDSSSQSFLRELDKKLCTATDRFKEKGAQAFRLFLQRDKATGKMPMLLTSTAKLIDDVLEASEKENLKLETVASVCDRRTNLSRSARFPHRARSNKSSDGRRPTVHLQINHTNLSSQFQNPDFPTHSNSFSESLSDLCAFAVTSSFPANYAWVQHMPQKLSRQSTASPDLAPKRATALRDRRGETLVIDIIADILFQHALPSTSLK